MWTFVLLAAAACPPNDLVTSSAGLAGISQGKLDPLTAQTLPAWFAGRPAGCTTTVWVEQGLAPPPVPKGARVEVKSFKKEAASIIRNAGYPQLPEDLRAMYPLSIGGQVGFIAVTLDQPTLRPWSGPAYRLLPNPQTELTPPFVTVRSSKIDYASPGFAVTWSKEKAWLPVGGWPLPIRFIDDGRADLPTEPPRAPLVPLGPAMKAAGKRCLALALVSTERGLTAIDGPRAQPLAGLEAASAWLRARRAQGCKLALTWWHPEGSAQPKPGSALGPVTFSTFAAGAPTFWGERELRTVPEAVLERSAPQPDEMVVRARVLVPYLLVCADPPGSSWKPPPPFPAQLEVQELRVEAPFAVFEPKRLRWSGAETTSGRCPPRWQEDDVLLRIPPTALPVRINIP